MFVKSLTLKCLVVKWHDVCKKLHPLMHLHEGRKVVILFFQLFKGLTFQNNVTYKRTKKEFLTLKKNFDDRIKSVWKVLLPAILQGGPECVALCSGHGNWTVQKVPADSQRPLIADLAHWCPSFRLCLSHLAWSSLVTGLYYFFEHFYSSLWWGSKGKRNLDFLSNFLLVFYHCNKIRERINLKGGKIHLDSWFQRFHSMVSWPVVRQSIMAECVW
jgi:hypothetical protein